MNPRIITIFLAFRDVCKYVPPFIIFFLAGYCLISCSEVYVDQWSRFEEQLVNSTGYSNPYFDVQLTVSYTRPDGSFFDFPGFYDGKNTWRFRCLPDQAGKWEYRARFSDGSKEKTGSFYCRESELNGKIDVYADNPYWFGYAGGKAVMIRSFQTGDRFFASNYDSLERVAFLDWAQQQGYNMLSISSHYLNRNRRSYGEGWNTPRLWPLDATEYQKLEKILDELANRNILVFPLAGFFGRSAYWPIDPEEQSQYIQYTLARLGYYNNILLNIAGPEPLLRPDEFQYGNMQRADIYRIGNRIKELDPLDHLLSVHNRMPVEEAEAYKDADPFMEESWEDYACFQGGKSEDLPEVYSFIVNNRKTIKPIYAHEVLWPGNTYHADMDSQQIRQKATVLIMAGASINFADHDGFASSGFSGTLDLNKKIQSRHDAIKRAWDFFESVPWYEMKPMPDFIPNAYCLADPGKKYLFYLPEYDTLRLPLDTANYQFEWISGADPERRFLRDSLESGAYFVPPDTIGDWFLNCFENIQ